MDNAKDTAKNAVDNVRKLSWTTLLPLIAILAGAFIYFVLQKKMLGLWMIVGGVVAYVIFNTPWFKNWQVRAKRNRMADEKKRAEYKGVVTTRYIEKARLPVIDKEFKKQTRYFIEGEVSAKLKRIIVVTKDEAKYLAEKEVDADGETSFSMEVSAELWNKLPEKSVVRLKAIQYLSLDEDVIDFDWRKAEPYIAKKKLLKPGKKKKAAKTAEAKAESNAQTEAPAEAGADKS